MQRYRSDKCPVDHLDDTQGVWFPIQLSATAPDTREQGTTLSDQFTPTLNRGLQPLLMMVLGSCYLLYMTKTERKKGGYMSTCTVRRKTY
jgi:hypothetical protein